VEAGMEPTLDLTGINLSGEVVVEKQFSDVKFVEVKDAIEWKVKTKGYG
jgi:hypothetical protein